jgi:hypothetical protein
MAFVLLFNEVVAEGYVEIKLNIKESAAGISPDVNAVLPLAYVPAAGPEGIIICGGYNGSL